MRASTEMMFFSFSHFLCGKCASPTIVEHSTIPTSAKLLQMYVTHFGKCDIRYGKCDISALFHHNIGHLSRDCGHFVLLLSRVVRIILFPVKLPYAYAYIILLWSPVCSALTGRDDTICTIWVQN